MSKASTEAAEATSPPALDEEELQRKYSALQDHLRELGSVLVAFSGGVDSSFLLATAVDVLGDRAAAATSCSETYPEEEFRQSQDLIKELGARQLVLRTSEIEIENFAANPVDRCYYCKKELFEALSRLAQENGLEHVVYGANADDVGDHRPGHRAAAELRVPAPMMEVGLTKAEIRELSRLRGLPTWDKPAMACLSSRFPYGQEITIEKLKMVGEAERFLRSLGVRQLRVRHHDDRIARIEVEPADVPKLASPEVSGRIVDHLKQLGYIYVALDLEGFRSGSMNEPLGIPPASGGGSA
ncbi:MAG: ATP-dependent sacrificial sulfur transferase LarE [Armatimonadota bacterium]